MSGDSGASARHLPYGIFSVGEGDRRVGVAVGNRVLDLAGALDDPVFSAATLNPFLAAGPAVWERTAQQVGAVLTADGRAAPVLHAMDDVRLHLPVEVADYVDFYSGLEHATNAGRILRPGQEPLKKNWRELPVAYHGRAGTVVVSGTDVVRPAGQIPTADGRPVLAPTARLDAEVEMAFVVGVPSRLGVPVPVEDFGRHVFGMLILIDWSARDIQAFEYEPLGPFLGKSFATTISPWVVPYQALEAARVEGPPQEPVPLPYLEHAQPRGLDIDLELVINGHVVSRPRFATHYWSAAQQMAHLTVNGGTLRTGDICASGTVSSFDVASQGSLLELSMNGTQPFVLPDGTTRGYLEDGDEVTVSASAPSVHGGRVEFGQAVGRILPARTP
jgi:fumarylacetoacetase